MRIASGNWRIIYLALCIFDFTFCGLFCGAEMDSEPVKVVGENSSSDAEDIDVEPWLIIKQIWNTKSTRGFMPW